LVMPFVDGMYLSHFVRKEAESSAKDFAEKEKFVGMIGLQLCAALHDMKGVLHRDIKPENIMLEERHDGKVGIKLLDFGYGKIAETNDPEIDEPGIVRGTEPFLAPELLAGAPNSVRTELYAAGATLYRLLTGKLPISREEVREAVAHKSGLKAWDKIKPPISYFKDMRNKNSAMNDILMNLLEADPGRRIGSPEELAMILGEALIAKYPELKPEAEEIMQEAGVKKQPVTPLHKVWNYIRGIFS